MGIDLELYRARIGSFDICLRSNIYYVIRNHVLFIFKMLSVGLNWWILILILLCGDIETNPRSTQVISGFLLNTRSVSSVNQGRNKLVELQALASLNESKIVCLIETWLDAALDAVFLLQFIHLLFPNVDLTSFLLIQTHWNCWLWRCAYLDNQK